MRYQNQIFFTVLVFSIFLTGCSPTETVTNTNITKATNTNVAVVNTNNPLETTKAPEAATSNNAPTLAPVVRNFYEALNKKDEAGVKKYLSQPALKYWDAEAKAERKTALAYLTEAEDPINEIREVRNEKITGETAIAEMKGGSLGVWTPIKFVRENGEWKFASPEDSLPLQNMPQTSTNGAK